MKWVPLDVQTMLQGGHLTQPHGLCEPVVGCIQASCGSARESSVAQGAAPAVNISARLEGEGNLHHAVGTGNAQAESGA